MPAAALVVLPSSVPVRKKSAPPNSTTLGSLLAVTCPLRLSSRSRSRVFIIWRSRKLTRPMALEFSIARMRVRKMSLLIGKRVLLTTGSSTMLGGMGARAICGIARMLRAILSVTETISWDSMPVPATAPRSSGRISVTGEPAGLRTPASVAQPARKAEPAVRLTKRKREVLFMVKGELGREFAGIGRAATGEAGHKPAMIVTGQTGRSRPTWVTAHRSSC